MSPAQLIGRTVAALVTVAAVAMATIDGNGFWILFGALVAAGFWNV